jgi:hypothetical protein
MGGYCMNHAFCGTVDVATEVAMAVVTTKYFGITPGDGSASVSIFRGQQPLVFFRDLFVLRNVPG